MDSRARYLQGRSVLSGLLDRARTLEALARYEDAELLLLGAVAGGGGRHPGQAPLWTLLGRVRRRLGAFTEAREALNVAATLLPPLAPRHHDKLEHEFEQAELESDCGDLDSAEATHRTVLAARLRALGPSHPDTLASRVAVAELCQLRGQQAEAWPLCRDVEQACTESLGPEHLLMARALLVRSTLAGSDGLLAEAEAPAARAVAIREAAFGAGHPEVAVAKLQLADVLRELDRIDEADALTIQACAAIEACLGPNHPMLAIALDRAAVLDRARGRFGEAETRLLRTLAIMQHAFSKPHPRLAEILYHLGLLYRDEMRLADAEAVLRRGLQVAQRACGSGREQPLCAGLLAEVLARTGRLNEAAALYSEAVPLAAQRLGGQHPLVGLMLGNLALLRHVAGDRDEADHLYRRAAAAGCACDDGSLNTILENHARLLRQTGSAAHGEHGQDRPVV